MGKPMDSIGAAETACFINLFARRNPGRYAVVRLSEKNSLCAAVRVVRQEIQPDAAVQRIAQRV